MRPLKYDPPSYTVADYNMWEGQWELIDGIPYAMSPSPVRAHQRMGKAIMRHLDDALTARKDTCGHCEVVYELDWIIGDDTVVRPDLALVCDQAGDFITAPPVLIVEILSPATALKDRQTKLQIYRAQGVRYYIVADPQTYSYTLYELSDGEYIKTDIKVFQIHEGCSIAIDLDTIMSMLKD